MNDKKPWADEPSPLCDKNAFGMLVPRPDYVYVDFARDLERRLRHALKLVGKLRADSKCGDFDMDDLEQRLTRIEKTLTP